MDGEVVTAFKCTTKDTVDFYTGKNAHVVGVTIIEPNHEPAGSGCCVPGLHVSPTAIEALRSMRHKRCEQTPWRFWRVSVAKADILDKQTRGDAEKWRVRAYRVEEEIPLATVIGCDPAVFQGRVATVRAEIETWPAIAWLRPEREITTTDLEPLIERWHAALSHYKRPGWWGTGELPKKARLVRTRAAAADAATATAATAAAAADAATAAADAADAAATAAAAADAAAAVTAAADAARSLWPYWCRWYIRPRYVLWRSVRWRLAGLPEDRNPWAPLVAMFRLGVIPIGYVRGEFVIYCPPPAAKATKEAA